ncbi:dynein axonemal heavy chain 5 isoform X2 [Pocillopora verrucosa]|uniref:dynein axonemal heavy chain 5 isoform X2 n=1 Tax=Pocillopora verrucosa TaxID=203993 RepID=UPI00333E22E8
MSEVPQEEAARSRAASPPSGEVAPPLISNAKDEEAKKGPKRRGAPRSAGRTAANAGPKKTVTLVTGSEAMKERQKQAKALKEHRKMTMDSRHNFILSKISDYIGVDGAVVEDFILGDDKFDQIEDFFAADGSRKLMFFYQECTINRVDLSSQAANSPRKLFITGGNTEELCGTCLMFIRATNKAITIQNIAQEVNFMPMETSKGDVLEGFQKLLGSILVPVLQKQENWGELPNSCGQVQEFLESLEKFVGILGGARSSMKGRVHLGDHDLGPLLDGLRTPTDYVLAANNPDVLDKLEGLVALWSKVIEQVLAESEQMRKEADDIGPTAELEHWKERMAKFNVLLDQVKSHHCKATVGVLHAAKSRSLKHWKELDSKITDAANEAKDNVKYLYTLDKFFGPLIKCSPTEMVEHIPSLMNAIRMIHSISQCYNTSERMTSLFVKVTNQMITTCKAYINRDVMKIWEHPREVLSGRLNECIRLNEEYQRCFHRTKQKLRENPSERQFEFSENYIFGKFDAFCKRLEKINDMLNTMETFAGVNNIKIEGMETMIVRYNSIVTSVKKKGYDLLDHRKGEFDIDYEEFKQSIEGLKLQLQMFVDSWFEKPLSTLRALELLQKFQNIGGVQLDLHDKYQRILMQYGRDLETCKKLYQKQKNDPPILRNLPPVAGKITWARQLFRRIHEPMKVFKTYPEILKGEDAKRIIRNYNKNAAVLVEFELLYHRGWFKAVEAAKSGLNASLLVRHPETKKLFVNFDPQILELIQEAKCMRRLNLEIPEAAQVMCMKEEQFKTCNNRLQEVLKEYDSVVSGIPENVLPLMKPFTDRVDETIKPGLTMLNWTSLNVHSYINSIQKSVKGLEILTKGVKDMLDCRIEAVLQDIELTRLCDLPEDEAVTVEDFVAVTEKTCQESAESLSKYNHLVESSVNILLQTLKDNLRPNELTGLDKENYPCLYPESKQAKNNKGNRCWECMPCCYWSLFIFFNQRCIEALVKSKRQSLDAIKRRMQAASKHSKDLSDSDAKSPALFKADIVLEIPSIVMKPSLDDIQQALNKTVQIMLKTTQNVYEWEQHGVIHQPPIIVAEEGKVLPPLAPKSLYKLVSEHKDVTKVVITLSSVVSSLKMDATKILDEMDQFKELWNQDPNTKVKEFMESKPLLSDFDAQIKYYQRLETQIEELPGSYHIGPVEYLTDRIKEALVTETKAWKQAFGKALAEKASADMEEIFLFIDNLNKRLARGIKDLDDVRSSMAALSEIRESEIRIDMTIGPIEESFAMMNRYGLVYSSSDAERVDGLTYAWRKLHAQAGTVASHLLQIQPTFKSDLLDGVERFKAMVTTFVLEYNEKGPMVSGIPPREASDRLGIFQARFDELWRKYETYSGGEELFGLTVTEYPNLQRIRKELGLLQKLYSLYNAVIENVNGYYDILWQEIDIEKINNELLEYQNRIRKLPKALKEWQAFLDLKKTIDDFSECCPLLEMMAHKAMKQRHWERISTITGVTLDVESETFQLRQLMSAPLLPNKEDIEDVCIAAVKERDIDFKLKGVVSEWSTQVFSFSNFKNRGELLLKGAETSDIVSLMEDSLMILGSLLSNRYNAPFKAEIQKWVAKLTGSTEIIENWLVVQNLWVYLEAVFVGGDIAKQLPQEAKRFSQIDKSWVKIMSRAHENSNVVQCCMGDDTLGQLLPHILEQLEICQKSLSGYLEKKRLVFPRFFFVSDPALLEILGQASDSHTIQAHLLGVFDNVKTVTFHEKEYDKILAINSREGESVTLENPVMAQGNVEVWLNTLLKESGTSLHSVIRTASIAIKDPSFKLKDFLDTYPAQVGLLGIQMIWTRDAEDSLTYAKSNKKIMDERNQFFLNMLNELIEVTTQELTKVERVKFETLVTIHVHQRDIFDELCRKNIKVPTDFEWLKQSRFYFREETDECVVSITDVDFVYQNEFLGCTDRLVITPLTDRCYITLAQALGMSMGGAPAGPAGTGKTETTKDMGKALGKFVVVFNCSDQMDYRGLGRIYKGLAQSGSWGCFDEFNRIELPVLSVAAQQIHVVLTCKKERKKMFIFTDGDEVDMDPEFGIFLTMNPGYAGRQELPENLKIMFRTVAMMVPDRQIIIRVKLAASGFIRNINLSQKFFTLYKLCEEQLTKQVHYDFGLRNILSVLRTLGAVKRANPEDSEDRIVMRVLRDMNLSKLVDEDEPLFMSLIDDLFPGLTLDKAGYPDIEQAIADAVEEVKLVNHAPWTLKLIQLYETQRVRHGMMALGPSGAGKTKCINILMKAMTQCGAPHKEYRMNPKAITAPQMFGRLDVSTNDWTDGIFSTLWRRTLRAKKGEHIWIVLDGPVDAIWIENLNSVLDDNKTLTLANGDRIPMAPNCKVVFEPHNIDNASPATVSRNGMVYMSSSALDWRPILQGWLNTRPQLEADVLFSLFESVFDELRTFVIQNCVPKMEVLECNNIVQAMNILEGLIPGEDAPKQVDASHLEKLFVFSLMWSVGALLELEDRKKMEGFLSGKGSLNLPPVEGQDTIFEYLVNEQGEWEHWSQRVPVYEYPKTTIPEYASILVPNVDNTRTDYLIHALAKQGKAVLLIGEQGSAKTVMMKGYCNKYDPEQQLFKSLNFSSATTPNMFQRTIESYVDKRMGTTYGPPAGKKMTVFVDDINMPIINEWGDQITNEIVRQVMEMKGFYSLDKPGDFTSIVDIQFVAAMIQPGGGRNDIPSRLKRQFTILNCTLPANASIDKIFSSIGSGYFNTERGFPAELQKMVNPLVSSTRKLWQKTKIKMLPTPAKFHYIFNLRDLSRIWQGMLTVTSEVATTPTIFLNLWKHECNRVIADRFTNQQDKDWFEKAIKQVVEEDFDAETSGLLEAEPYFVDFMRDAPEPTGDEPEDADLEAPKVYEHIGTLETLKERLGTFMIGYNEVVRGGNMDLVFFKDAMVHLIKISRIIRTPRGNALLVGVGGSGKQSLTRLASFIAGYQIFQITLTRSYNVSNLMDDLKVLYRTAGHQGKGITFIFTDNEIKDEGFLEYMNNVIASGEVSNLFARDEIDEITQDLISVMKAEYPRRPPTNENLYDYFITRVKNNLHVVLCFSPVGEKFRNRSLKFPGLFSGCTMDWFSRWPKDALIAVASHFLSSFEIVCTAETKLAVVNTMGVIQDNVAEMCVQYFERFRRQTHVTPKSYLSFLGGYKDIYSSQYEAIGLLAQRMNTGLAKLVEASESVAKLSEELVVKEKELAVASKKADVVLQEVTVSATAAEKVKSQVQKVKDKAQAIVDEIAGDKAVAEGKLEAAKPALEEAEAALQTIKPAHISTVRKLAKPPHLIMRIMDCVLLLFNRKIDPVTADPEKACLKPSWGESLKLMSGGGFLNTLLTFPKDSINEETVELLMPYLEMEDYTIEVAKKVCGDVAGLASWTKAMAFFYTINKEVLPLKANLIIQEARLQKATAELNEAQAQLDEKQRELDLVQAKYDQAMRDKQTLVEDAEACRRKMANATALIDGLGGEKVRWTEQSKKFDQQIQRLVGDVLLATGFLSYSGPFNQAFRTLLLDNWKKEMRKKKIPFSEDLNLVNMLTDAATIGEWALQGLPSDELSVQNGIIVTKAARYPLLIDPQGQGKAWIRKKEGPNELQATALNHKYFRTHLEDSLSLGRPLIIEDVGEELDPALDNVLEKNFIKSGKTFKVKVGDKEVDVMDGFRLYVTTKLGNPSYTPEVSAKTSIIDFTVTMSGLEDQLLGRVILTEKQELEAERTKLMEEVTANKRKMKDLEDNLLYRLTSTQGSLVEDESLIQVLSVTKTTSEEVSEKLLVAAETEVKINTAREEYRPVATRGSILYFLIVEMSYVNVMYQTSLRQFLGLFDISMARSQKSPIPAKRIQNIIEYLTFEVFRYTTRGLYEEHKFLFTLLLTLKIDLQERKIRHDEFQVLIKGGAALDLNAVEPKPKKWILDMTWLNLVALSKLPQFTQLLGQVANNESGKAWKTWFDSEAPEDAPIPDGYQGSLDTFRKLLLIRAWCPDRTINQARRYITDAIGKEYAEGVILNLEVMWEESDIRTPMICFLSMGSDPTASIEALAKKQRLDCRAISMGQGQEVHARRLLAQFMNEGGWVLLQNCHLGLNFMDELLETITTTENVNEKFRLWITTEVHPKFPITLLQSSIKFTNEPPQGIKAGLKRTYAGITQDQLDVTNMPQWKPMLYATAFLHTIVQERRKFGPLGWNIPYEFNSADLTASVQFIQNHLDDIDPKAGVSWVTVHYMLGEVQYGGRVTDDFDKRLLNTYARVWFSQEMFKETFKFYQGYNIPRCAQIADFKAHIDEMPLSDTPEVFGLHTNADITYQTKTTSDVLETIVNIQPKDSSGGSGETRESLVARQATEMLDKLPPDYVPFEVKARLQKMGALTSMNIFLRQEIDRMQRVITAVRNTLVDLKLAIDGTIIMSENLKDALDNIYDARVPALWKKISWDSTTLGFWFTELIERNNQFHSWLFEGRPSAFWMTGFFNPQGFLTAMRQEITRAHKGWALDNVALANDVTKMMKEDVSSSPAEGVYVHGLFLDGAGWDRRNCRLTEPSPKVLFTALPVVHIYAVNTAALIKDLKNNPDALKFYECPVYKKPRRTDLTYIFCLNLKTSQHPDHWILRGVALLCDTK